MDYCLFRHRGLSLQTVDLLSGVSHVPLVLFKEIIPTGSKVEQNAIARLHPSGAFTVYAFGRASFTELAIICRTKQELASVANKQLSIP